MIQVFTNRHKMCYVYLTEYYSDIKRNELLMPATTLMTFEKLMLSKIMQTQKDKYFTVPFI